MTSQIWSLWLPQWAINSGVDQGKYQIGWWFCTWVSHHSVTNDLCLMIPSFKACPGSTCPSKDSRVAKVHWLCLLDAVQGLFWNQVITLLNQPPLLEELSLLPVKKISQTFEARIGAEVPYSFLPQNLQAKDWAWQLNLCKPALSQFAPKLAGKGLQVLRDEQDDHFLFLPVLLSHSISKFCVVQQYTPSTFHQCFLLFSPSVW